MKRIVSAAMLALAGMMLGPGPAAALSDAEAARKLEALTWYSEEYPPYNFKGADGLATGMAVDILMAAFKKIGVDLAPGHITIAPWNRSYKYIQKKPGTALFSMTYTPERQKIMKFVGPSVPSNVSVIAPKKSALKVSTAADLSDLTIGVVRDDIGDQLIREMALSDSTIKKKNSLKQVLYLLGRGRVDAVAYAVDVFRHAVKKSGGDPNGYEEVMVLKEGELGYAFHKSTDPAVLAPLQKAVDALRADGTIDRIIATYSK